MSGLIVVDVTDFGADPSGQRCSAAAVAHAIASVAGCRARVRFPHGRYAFTQEGAVERELYVSNTVGQDPRYRSKRIAILIEEAEDLEIDGDGSTFIFHGTQTMIAVLDSVRVRVRDIEMDFARPTVVDATVVSVGSAEGHAFRELTVPDNTVFRVEGEHVVWVGEDDPSGAPYWEMRDAGEYCQVLDPSGITRRTSDPVFDDVLSVSDRGRRIRVVYRHNRVPDDVGAVYQYRRTTRDHPGVAILDSEETTLERMRFRFLHGFGVVAQNGRDLRVVDCVFAPPAGSGRVTAGFADFLQCSGMSGHIDVQDTIFLGAHDDPINIHGTYLRVVGIESPDRIDLEYAHPETAGFGQFSPGDRIEIIDADLLRPLVQPFTIVAADQPTGRDHARDLRRLSVRVSPPLPDSIQAIDVRMAVENITRTPDVSIERCRFGRVPTRGVLVTTRGEVRIADSDFVRLQMPSIYISADAAEWWESGPVTHVVIEGNRFIEPGDALVEIEPSAREVDSQHPIHGHIEIRKNTVVATSDVTVVRARSVAELSVTGTILPAGVEGLVCTQAVTKLRLDDDLTAVRGGP